MKGRCNFGIKWCACEPFIFFNGVRVSPLLHFIAGSS
jgi:hypothetical protein